MEAGELTGAILPLELERKEDGSSKIMDAIFLDLVLLETENKHSKESYRGSNLRGLLNLHPELEIYQKYLQAGEEIKYLIVDNLYQGFKELCWCLDIVQPSRIMVIFLGGKEVRILKVNDDNCERKIYKGDNITIKDIINYNLKDMGGIFRRRRVCKNIAKQENFDKLDPNTLSHILSHCVPTEATEENMKPFPPIIRRINTDQAARGV